MVTTNCPRQILAPRDFVADRPSRKCASASRSTRFGEIQRQIVLADDGKHVHARRVRRPEHFDDFAFGIDVARFPCLESHHDLVARRALSAARPAGLT